MPARLSNVGLEGFRIHAMQVTQFSTQHLPPAERFETWRRGRSTISSLYETTPEEPFDVRATGFSLGDVDVQFATVTGQHWIRDQSNIRSWNPEIVLASLTLDGTSRGEWNGKASEATAGALLFSDSRLPSSHVSSRGAAILFCLPRTAAVAIGLETESLHGRVFRSPMVNCLATHMHGLRAEAERLPDVAAPALGRSVMDLLSLAAGESVEYKPGKGRQDGMALAARAAIERQLNSHRLSIASLCHQLSMSRSTLHRLFAEEGGVGAYIREQRLQRAHDQVLRNMEPLHVIAERYAFSDAAHFSRLFKARFGYSPRVLRHFGTPGTADR